MTNINEIISNHIELDYNEILSRRKNLLSSIPDNSAILISSPSNMYYYSLYQGDCGYLIYSKNIWYLLTDSRYTTDAGNSVVECEVIEINSTNSYIKVIHELVGSNKILFEGEHLSYNQFNLINENLSNKLFKFSTDKLIDATNIINKPRQVKSIYEIEQIKQAEEIGSHAFLHVLNFIKPGISELDIAAEIEFFMKKSGALKTSFDTIVASGPNGSKPHAIPCNRKIVEGDLITMDFGCIYNHYCSDMTRTIAVGKIENDQEDIYNIVLEAQLNAIENIKEGVIGKSIDKIARDYIALKGYGKCFGHGLGHSLGLDIHENPNFNTVCNDEIKENMVLSVEPGIYIPNKFGIRIEDIVQITKYGCNNLTSAPKKLYHI